MPKIKLASFNCENLFDRARALNQDTWSDGKPVLDLYGKVTALLNKEKYSAADKAKILDGLKGLGLLKSDDAKFVTLRQNRGHLVTRTKAGPVEVVADGRGDWVGWLELKREEVSEEATRNTARVLKAVDADIVGLVEIENRPGLVKFNENVLGTDPVGGAAYDHVMMIDGNDDRGIDVAVMTRGSFDIRLIRSHVDDRLPSGERIFSRDCAEFEIAMPSGPSLLLMVNHLKSKGYGTPAVSNARRRAQATRIRQIYDAHRAAGVKWIAIVGDFNDTPDSDPLEPLLGNGSDLADVSSHGTFQSDGRPGTYANGTASNKIDYVLLSPDLSAKVTAAGYYRLGVWGGKNGDLFPHMETITKASEAASDHAAVWVELTV